MTKIMVDTDWVAEHLKDPALRILECNPDPKLYVEGHIPGAQRLDFSVDLSDSQTRDLIEAAELEDLMSRLGIDNDSTICLYGSYNNLCSCHAYWAFRIFGHHRLCLMDGGRERWLREKRQLEYDIPVFEKTRYRVQEQNFALRAGRDEVLDHIGSPDPRAPRFQMPENRALVDDRTPSEFNGKLDATAPYPVRSLRGGRIPGAVNMPFTELFRDDGRFKSPEQLRTMYESRDITADKDVICYTRLGERSAVTWFVLHEMLGYPRVRNYDGAWMEWGNLVGMPVEHATRAVVSVVPPGVGRATTSSRRTVSA
jgi:thiosulfate/3-mercaptopyruvate sulfurtransferase